MFKKIKIFRKYPLCGIGGNLFFSFYNFWAFLFFKNKAVKEEPISRILLCCRASLGDVFLACLVIPSLKAHFPKAQIGFLCTPETVVILEGVKGIDFIHPVKRRRFLDSKKDVIEIRKMGYQMSFELHPFFPNSILLVTRAGIPRRIGFDSGGYDLLLTDPVIFLEKSEYLPCLYRKLLEKVGVDFFYPKPDISIKHAEYIVLHLGTSTPLKEWDLRKWRGLALLLKEEGHTLVFTGKGERERLLIQEAFEGIEGRNFCDLLDWNGFSLLIKEAKAVISVDSLPVHVASFYQVPTVALYLYSHGVELWLPNNDNLALLIGKNCIRRNKELFHPKATYLDEIEVLDVMYSLKNIL